MLGENEITVVRHEQSSRIEIRHRIDSYDSDTLTEISVCELCARDVKWALCNGYYEGEIEIQ